MTLHATRVVASGASPTQWAMVIHGILGCGGNWRTFARRLVEAWPEVGILLPDLRHHGRTGPLDGSATVDACVADLEDACASLEAPVRAVLGHSFGGKVALAWAARTSSSLEEVWVLDSPPGVRVPGEDPGGPMIARLLQVMAGLAQPSASREDVQEGLIRVGLAPGTAAWLCTNLRWAPEVGGYTWRVDLAAIEALIEDYFALDTWPMVTALHPRARVHLVRGGQSDRWAPAQWARVEAHQSSGQLGVHWLEEAGHWLHVDDPGGLMGLLEKGGFFSGQASGPRMDGA